MSAELKPCPFCGGTSVSVVEGDTYRWRVAQCNECGACASDVRMMTVGTGTKEEWEAFAKARALDEWNKRV